MLALHLLGPIELRRDGVALPLPVRKAAALLVLLALGGPIPRARVVAMLWPDLDEPTGRRNLRRELARMRDTGVGDAIAVDGDRLALAGGIALDSSRFEALRDEAGAEAALALWRGPPADGLELDDVPPIAEWLAAERERLQALWRGTVEDAATRAEAEGRVDAALGWLDRLLADDPLQERHHRAAMRLLAAAGRREAALQRYQRCRELLQAELGLAPMPETEALAAALRGAAPAAAPAPADAPRTLLPDRMPFVGREHEVGWLERAWRAGGTLLIEGEGGVGKSRLALDFAAAHAPYATARCRPGDAELPLASVARMLRVLAGPVPVVGELPAWVPAELARVLPELGPSPPPVRSEAERARLGQACVAAWQAWAGGNFDAVVVDDWHLADPSSQALLAQMAGTDAGGARLVLVYRPELTPAAAALLRGLREAGAAWLRLEPLPPDAVYELVRRLSGTARPERFAALLSRATAGHPFYVAETLRHLVDAGLLTAGADGVWQTPYDEATLDYRELPLPASVREAVLGRVRRLDEPARRVLDAAALAEEPFAARLLAPACALSEVEAGLALEAALDARLLREHDAGGFGFAHDLVQQALASALGDARRRSVHRRLALGAAAAGAPPAQLAAHHEAGGDPARAVEWRRRAGDEAMRLLALDEAIVQWRHALDDGPSADDRLAIGIDLLRALERRSRDEEQEAVAAQLLGQVDAGIGSLAQRDEALVALANLRSRNERAHEGLALLARATPTDDPRARLKRLAVRAEAERSLGHLDAARALQRQALALPGLQVSERIDLLDSLALTDFHAGRLRDALVSIDEALALIRSTGDHLALVRALGRRASALLELGDHGPAEQGLREAATMSGRLGLVSQQRSMLFNLCVLYSAQSRPSAVLHEATVAWGLAPPIGAEPMRTQLRLAFVEAHSALGELGQARHWALGAIDDATLLGQWIGRVAVLSTAAEVLAVLGEIERLDPLLDSLEPEVLAQLRSSGIEMWLILSECALMEGDLPRARERWAACQWASETEGRRQQARIAGVDAAMRLAEGDAAGALQRLPADDTPGTNDELRWRALTVRLGAEHALGGCRPQTVQAAEAALARDGVHALAAMQLHRALVRADPGPARRAAWQARVDRLAGTLAGEPALQDRFRRRWRDGA